MKMAVAAVLLIGAGSAVAMQDEPMSLDLMLKLMTMASAEKFRPLMTFRVERRPGGDSYYESKYLLPQAEWCRIFEHPNLALICEWRNRKDRVFADVANQYQRALGEGWKRTDRMMRGRRKVHFDRAEKRRDYAIELSDLATGMEFRLRAINREE